MNSHKCSQNEIKEIPGLPETSSSFCSRHYGEPPWDRNYSKLLVARPLAHCAEPDVGQRWELGRVGDLAKPVDPVVVHLLLTDWNLYSHSHSQVLEGVGLGLGIRRVRRLLVGLRRSRHDFPPSLRDVRPGADVHCWGSWRSWGREGRFWRRARRRPADLQRAGSCRIHIHPHGTVWVLSWVWVSRGCLEESDKDPWVRGRLPQSQPQASGAERVERESWGESGKRMLLNVFIKLVPLDILKILHYIEVVFFFFNVWVWQDLW
jgi:hypothetical protein